MLEKVSSFLVSLNLPVDYVSPLSIMVLFIFVLLSSYVTHIVIKLIFLPIISKLIQKSEIVWDDALIASGFINRLFQFIPVIILYLAIPIVFSDFFFLPYIVTVLELFLIILISLLVNSSLTAILFVSKSLRFNKSVALISYIQVLRLIVVFVTIIIAVSLLIGKSPAVLLSGLGALSAVLLLVFKDTIMGFVASLQLTFNKLVETGDWIEVPEYGADGNVVDVSLTTIKVQNWDKTITTIPTYSLVSGSFKNWKGMEESGGRRIKRSIHIDMTSVKFVNDKQMLKLQKISLLQDWLSHRTNDINSFNQSIGLASDTHLNGRHLTNLGVFRSYLELYLHQHPEIHDEMTFLVRHLDPTESGVPVEFYVFSKNKDWADFEAIQADIMDHILAILPQFGLRVFQSPSGFDLKLLAASRS